MTTDHEMHVVMFAFACEPDRGSEPGVGWEFAYALAEACRRYNWQATLVTRTHRVPLLRARLGDLNEYMEIRGIDIPAWLIRATGRRHVRVAYLWWLVGARRAVRRYQMEEGRVVFHHVTFASDTLPNPLPRKHRPNHKTVLGPAGAAVVSSKKRRLVSAVRMLFEWSNSLNLDLFIAQNEVVARRWEARMPRHKVMVEPNILLAPTLGAAGEVCVAPTPRSSRPVRVIILGRLIPRKNVDLALRSLAAWDADCTIDVVGDGPEEPRLRELALEVELHGRATFHGPLPHGEAISMMRNSHILLHTSRQEGAGWVIGEAQAAGCVPVALKGSGADTAIELGQLGVVADIPNIAGIVDALTRAVAVADENPAGSNRWSNERAGYLLQEWYSGEENWGAPRE